jgi:putative ATP-dependent endonuclease of OLD family
MRAGMRDFAPFFKMYNDNGSAKDLQNAYIEIQKKYPEVKSVKTKQGMNEALRGYETACHDKCELLESADEFYGISKGVNKLEKYIQWVFVPAVKDAVSEGSEVKDTALGRLLERTVRAKVNFKDSIKKLRDETERSYDALLAESQSSLDGVSKSLCSKLTQWAHPGAELKLMWNKDPKKSVQVQEPFAKILAGEGQFQGELVRFGHGLQRSYLLALLHELATGDESNAPRLLLAIEEPELFQHPPQERHLAEVLQELSEGNAQIFSCTHSPHFVIGKGFEDIRLVRKTKSGAESKVSRTTFREVATQLFKATGDDNDKKEKGIPSKLHQALQPALKEMFFCSVLVLVEGLEDIAYITTGLHLSGLWTEWRQLGGHIVAVNGKSELLQPLCIAQIMNIPTFVIIDADGDEHDPRYRPLHERDNTRILKLLGQPTHDVFPSQTSWQSDFIVWPENIRKAIENDFLAADWKRWKDAVELNHGQTGALGKKDLFIADIMTTAWADSKPSQTLTHLCESLISFARSSKL